MKNKQKNYIVDPIGKNQFKITATMDPINEDKRIYSLIETHKIIVLAKNGDLNSISLYRNLKYLLPSMNFII